MKHLILTDEEFRILQSFIWVSTAPELREQVAENHETTPDHVLYVLGKVFAHLED